jgi:hypothetical protein
MDKGGGEGTRGGDWGSAEGGTLETETGGKKGIDQGRKNPYLSRMLA